LSGINFWSYQMTSASTRRSRLDAAKYCSDKVGFSITKNAFDRMASDGTGPAYEMILGRASYRQDALDDWIEGLISAPKKRPRTRNPLTRNGQMPAKASQSLGLPADVAA
jgi:hypothetical protein